MARTQPTAQAQHPGTFIRESVLRPKKLSVTKAAQMMGVGRPALSNLLNGRASLSPEMALRVEKAFGVKSQILLRLQSNYDEERARDQASGIAVRSYSPKFLTVTASELEAWADQIETRSLLPALLRRLIQTSDVNLTKLDFPAYDNAQRAGWDGQLESETATPWIPIGQSGWEFGTNRDPRRKADDDYASRVESIPLSERKGMTLVFVTLRNWPGKAAWANDRRSENTWKDVRALDASDLEQWIEQSVPTQAWMAEQLGRGSEDILSLDECWKRWARVTEPELSKELFRGAVGVHKSKLERWLTEPLSRPLVVTGASEDEALAFISCLFESIGDPHNKLYDKALVLRSVDALRKATRASTTFIPILASSEAEKASAGLHKERHTIVVRRHTALENEAEIILDLLDYETFRKALLAMGIDQDDVQRYSRESGLSATILRRRLASVPAIRIPPWAQPTPQSRKLIPIALAGVWNSDIQADRDILQVLTDETAYQNIEHTVSELLRSPQTPVWKVGKYRGVASKIDVLYALRDQITKRDLDNFFMMAYHVLSEEDPALELPEDQRHFANMYGKTRNHSPALREGICESLVLLAVHGNNLFRTTLGIDIEAEVTHVIRKLLIPLTPALLGSQQHDLPRYAEAAPGLFLQTIEDDLETDSPQVLTLLRPASSDIFGAGCPRTGLLWALECLAWNPQQFRRVVPILGRISEVRIEDNWANKPESSLKSIFRSWMPQTAAPLDVRKKALDDLMKRVPSVGWRVCIDQFDPHATIGTYNYRPRWRNDASGAGQPVTRGEVYAFARHALDIALTWPNHDANTLGDLVERLRQMSEADQERVWEAITAWAKTNPTDQQKADLRERIRVYAFTRRGRQLPNRVKDSAAEVQKLLEASDPIARYHWLFAKQWVETSYDELDGEAFNHQKREERILQQRTNALREIWSTLGYEGILQLCKTGEASSVIGRILSDAIVEGKAAIDFVDRLAAESHSPEWVIDACLSGFLFQSSPEERERRLRQLKARLFGDEASDNTRLLRILKASPLDQTTWKVLNELPEPMRAQYWREIDPQWHRQSSEDLHEIVDRLLEAGRPVAAFMAVRLDLREINTRSLARLLHDVATKDSGSDKKYRFSSYEITEAFKILSSRADAPSDTEMAQLEFFYLETLRDDEYGIPHLEKQLAESPLMFAQAIGLLYKRDDDGEDPPEWRASNPEATSSIANQAYRLIHNAKRIPGTQDDGSVNVEKLVEWITEVRALCRQHARVVVGDHSIGELLSKSGVGADGVWPSEPVRQALEQVGTKEIAVGMSIGLYNSRGAEFRGEGGEQERELAAKYRDMAKQVAIDYPFSARLLEQIAHGYDRDAEWHDTDSSIRKRLPY